MPSIRIKEYALINPIKISEENAYSKVIHEYKLLMKSLPKEEIKEILRRSIGSRNMLKLSAMVEFLRVERGSSTSEKFVRNIVLLSLLYGSGKGKKELSFADLVFQALYATLSKNS